MHQMRIISVISVMFGVIFSGCAQPQDLTLITESHLTKEQAERYASNDDPSDWDSNLEYRFAQLPLEGHAAKTPWAGNYWPLYQDMINYRWNGTSTQSPAAKYGEAFNVNNPEDLVSSFGGIESQSSRKSCTQDSDCDPKIAEKCAKRTGETSGRCIPSWWGICHSWAPLSIMYPEPVNPVTRNGVTFKVNDIKALVTFLGAESQNINAMMLSGRCDEDEEAGDINYDEFGRPQPRQCRDTNPATLHITLANYLGIKKESFVEERTFDDQVWNQPLEGYKVLAQREVTAQEANELVGVPPSETTDTKSGKIAKNAWTHFNSYSIQAGDKVTVTMSGTGDADLYVKFNSQPSANSHDCRPYKNSTNETCDLTAPSGATTVYVSVTGYANESDFSLNIKVSTFPSDYQFNHRATKFYYVKTRVSYITESSAVTDGNLASTISEYTKEDVYEYILEEENGKLRGGELIGSSKRNHPDFLWLPTGLKSRPTLPTGFDKDTILSLLDESVGESTWVGNGSIIHKDSRAGSTSNRKYGQNVDVSRLHHGGSDKQVAFFQWQVDASNGPHLQISLEGNGNKNVPATITYGSWDSRSKDVSYKNLTLPFVLNPANDGFSATGYFVIAVEFHGKSNQTLQVQALPTSAAATAGQRVPAGEVVVDGHVWTGNASIITAAASGRGGDWGIIKDVANIHPGTSKPPVVMFQWQVTNQKKLEIKADGMSTATLTYGSWASRGSDVTKTVSLPYTLQAASGIEWYTIKVEFDGSPSQSTGVYAIAK